MGFYVYVFKNKYCCLLVVVDLLGINTELLDLVRLKNEDLRLDWTSRALRLG